LGIWHERQPRRTPGNRTRRAVTPGRHKLGVGRRARIQRLAQQDKRLQDGADEQRHEIGPTDLRPVHRTDLVRAGGELGGERGKGGRSFHNSDHRINAGIIATKF